ncbi:hypothetical protein SALWKB12_1582 [Snodgrassella communis]|nr:MULTISPECIES: hypothetical protein [Snodgrassella]KDN12042.1 hypothetical protein SALWKB12_1582 [Snodgrassella communis]
MIHPWTENSGFSDLYSFTHTPRIVTSVFIACCKCFTASGAIID